MDYGMEFVAGPGVVVDRLGARTYVEGRLM